MRFHDLLNKPSQLKETKKAKVPSAQSYEKRLQQQLKESMKSQGIK